MHPRKLKKKEANVSAMEERSQTEIDYVELKSGLTTRFVSTASIPARKFSTASELADFVHVSTFTQQSGMKSANGD
jgi:transcriptional regulator